MLFDGFWKFLGVKAVTRCLSKILRKRCGNIFRKSCGNMFGKRCGNICQQLSVSLVPIVGEGDIGAENIV